MNTGILPSTADSVDDPAPTTELIAAARAVGVGEDWLTGATVAAAGEMALYTVCAIARLGATAMRADSAELTPVAAAGAAAGVTGAPAADRAAADRAGALARFAEFAVRAAGLVARVLFDETDDAVVESPLPLSAAAAPAGAAATDNPNANAAAPI